MKSNKQKKVLGKSKKNASNCQRKSQSLNLITRKGKQSFLIASLFLSLQQSSKQAFTVINEYLSY